MKRIGKSIFIVAAVVTLGACAQNQVQNELSMTEVSALLSRGAIQPFSTLNADVLARHPGSEVAHAALDKDGDRYLYQASLVDPYKMQWFVELDAASGAAITDRQE